MAILGGKLKITNRYNGSLIEISSCSIVVNENIFTWFPKLEYNEWIHYQTSMYFYFYYFSKREIVPLTWITFFGARFCERFYCYPRFFRTATRTPWDARHLKHHFCFLFDQSYPRIVITIMLSCITQRVWWRVVEWIFVFIVTLVCLLTNNKCCGLVGFLCIRCWYTLRSRPAASIDVVLSS